MDFNTETQNAMNKVIAEKLPEMIEKQTTKMVEDIVSSMFSYGNIKDSIKKKLEESINVNLQEFDLIDYNALISKTINENLLKQVNLQPILDMTQDIIGFEKKKEISLDEVADIFRQASQEENDQSGEGEITFTVEENDEHDWVSVFADVEPNKKNHECSIKFIFSTKGSRNGQIFVFKTNDHWYDNKQKEVSAARMVNMSGIIHKIFRLYSAQVKITGYEDEVSIYWDRY